ncbi:SCO family protein [Bacillus spongiae]
MIMISALVLLAACSNRDFEPEMEKKINDFSVTDQNGEPFELADLKGKVTLVDFIFTNCETVCPPMTFNMSKIQRMLADEGVTDYQIASFSVDPERDTPEVLKEYIAQYEANEDNWFLLTGYDQKWISQLAAESFSTIVFDEPDSDQVTHSVRFYLVDQNGTVVKSYFGTKTSADAEEVQYDLIVSDLKHLVKVGPVE